MNVPPPKIGNRVPDDLLNILIQQQQNQKQQINHNGFGNPSQVNLNLLYKNIHLNKFKNYFLGSSTFRWQWNR